MLVLWMSALLLSASAERDTFTRFVGMPQARPEAMDDLLCHAEPMDPSRDSYIVRYEPHASSDTAHHMMLYGCRRPFSADAVWRCGGGMICEENSDDIVFAWALNAPAKDLPEGVGFRVGGTTDIKYLVVQLHYRRAFADDERDSSGYQLHMTHEPQRYQLGFYVMGSMGFIPPMQPNFHMESACKYNLPYPIYPIAYRTHAHTLGRVIAGYLRRDEQWIELGRMSPQQPQMFYDVSTPNLTLSTGDVLAARCTMNSMERTEDTAIGETHHDEMCNFYLMYYTEWKDNLRVRFCFQDAPRFKWAEHFPDVPPLASSLEGVHLTIPDDEPEDSPIHHPDKYPNQRRGHPDVM